LVRRIFAALVFGAQLCSARAGSEDNATHAQASDAIDAKPTALMMGDLSPKTFSKIEQSPLSSWRRLLSIFGGVSGSSQQHSAEYMGAR
jgi:hypothetical protein